MKNIFKILIGLMVLVGAYDLYAIEQFSRVKVWGREVLTKDDLNAEFDAIVNGLNTKLLNGGTTFTIVAGDSILVEGRGVMDTLRVRTVFLLEGDIVPNADGAYNIGTSGARVDTFWVQDINAYKVETDTLTAQITTSDSINVDGLLIVDPTRNEGYFIGDFGVDNTTPGTSSSAARTLHVGNSATGSSGITLQDNEQSWEIYVDNTFRISQIGAAERFRIDANGIVGIGDTSPAVESAKLTVYDNTASSLATFYLKQDNASASRTNFESVYDGSGQNFIVSNTGSNVAIRSISSPHDSTLSTGSVIERAGGTSINFSDDTSGILFTNSNTAGQLRISYHPSGGGAGDSATYYISAIAGSAICKIESQTAGNIYASATSALSGTTGSDTKITVGVDSDGSIYVENRSGASIGIWWQYIGR